MTYCFSKRKQNQVRGVCDKVKDLAIERSREYPACLRMKAIKLASDL